MVELVVRELKHDIEAFQDFNRFRRQEAKRRGRESSATRAEWVDAKRRQLHQRMRRRRRGRATTSRRSARARAPFSLW